MRDEASIRSNAIVTLASQLLGAAGTAGLTIYLARALGPDGFGVFSLALSISSTLLLFSEFGVSTAAARFVAEGRADNREVVDVLASALRLKLFLAGTVCVGLFLLAGPIASAYGEPDLVFALRAMSVALFGQNLMALYGSAFTAMARATYAFKMVVVESVVEVVATVALVMISASAGEAAFGRAVGYGVGGLFALALAARVLGRNSVDPRAGELFNIKRVASYAGPLFVINSAFAFFSQVDVLLIGALLNATAAGLFQAPLRLVGLLGYPAASLSHAVGPHLAASRGKPRRAEPLSAAIRYAILFQAGLVAPIVIWANPIIELVLGAGYTESVPVLRALAPFAFLLGFGSLLSLSVNYMGRARRRVPLALGTLALNVAIDVVLIPKMGIIGGAIGTDIAFLAYVAGHLWLCHDIIDLPLRPLLPTLARASLAALAMAGTLLSFGTSGISVPTLLIGGVAGVLIYAATLILLGETTLAELRSLRRPATGS